MSKGKVVRLRDKTVDAIQEARKHIILSDSEFYNDCLTDDNIIWIALKFWIEFGRKGNLL